MKKTSKSVTKTKNQNTTEKMTSKAKTASKVKKSQPEPELANISQNMVHDSISKLETAYLSAMSGEMRFKKVKSMFKKLHKEIKSTVKNQKK